MSAGDNMQAFGTRTLRMARVLARTSRFDQISSKDIQRARHMAHADATAAEIAAALNWTVHHTTALKWLKQLNITPFDCMNRQHQSRGEETTLPDGKTVSMARYRPRSVA